MLKKNLNANFSTALTIFVRNDLDEAKEYYQKLVIENGDKDSARNFCEELEKGNKLKGLLNKKNIHLVQSGAGIEQLIIDYKSLVSLIKDIRESGIKTLLFALPDYEESLEIIISAINEGFK